MNYETQNGITDLMPKHCPKCGGYHQGYLCPYFDRPESTIIAPVSPVFYHNISLSEEDILKIAEKVKELMEQP
jgi:hypothetical protein